MHILFWIALTLSPPDATQILVKGPNLTAAWTRVERGWSYSADRSIWSVEKTAVKTSASDGKTDKIDVGESVKGIQDHDWRKSATLRLEHGETLAKEGETFVFTLAAGTPDEKRFVIQHRRKSAPHRSRQLAPFSNFISCPTTANHLAGRFIRRLSTRHARVSLPRRSRNWRKKDRKRRALWAASFSGSNWPLK